MTTRSEKERPNGDEPIAPSVGVGDGSETSGAREAASGDDDQVLGSGPHSRSGSIASSLQRTDPPPEELPRLLGERYRLETLLARGGMGRVYVATQLALDRSVAIKLLVPPPNVGGDFRRRFLLEASVCARLNHPHIVVVHDYGETPSGELFMAMELLDGEPLDRLIKAQGALDPRRAVRIALQISRALRAAHREGIAHRDLKPGNVFVLRARHDEDNHDVETVKVLDFGLVKVYEEGRAPVDRDVTEGDLMLGSPRYMSPEQISCEPVDARSDIYSLGIVLFALLTGRPPYIGRSSIDILTQHLQRPVPPFASIFAESDMAPPFDLPVQLERLVHRCMAKDPADRYQDIDTLIVALKHVGAVLGDAGGAGTTDSGPRRPLDSTEMDVGLVTEDGDSGPVATGPERSKWGPLVAVLIGVVALAAIVVVALSPSDEAPRMERAPASQPEEISAVEVSVTSDPPGAEVISGGVILGVTPLTRSLPPTPNGARRVFEIRLDGHSPARVSAALEDEAVRLHSTLDPVPPPEPPALAFEEAPPPSEVEEPPAEEARSGTARPHRARAPRTTAPAQPEPATAPPPARPSILVDRDRRRIPIVD